jgi:hypothetical protein
MGTETPEHTLGMVLDENGILNPELITWISKDKQKYCEKCNWSCMIMSKSMEDKSSSVESLLHSSKRK